MYNENENKTFNFILLAVAESILMFMKKKKYILNGEFIQGNIWFCKILSNYKYCCINIKLLTASDTEIKESMWKKISQCQSIFTH